MLDENTGIPYIHPMRTAIETPTFQRQADDYWTEDQRLDFLAWLAANPEAGDVIPGADGARKVRWTLPGIGKRGGARVIYFNHAEDGTVLLAMMYAKSDRENVSSGDIMRVL
jgi:hypothetical protein